MLQLNCVDNTFHVSAAQCGGVPQTATLCARRGGWLLSSILGQSAELDVTFDEDTGLYGIGPIPEETCTGGYTVFIRTDSCCFTLPVYVNACPPPLLPSIHTPTNPPGIIVSCCPEEEEDNGTE